MCKASILWDSAGKSAPAVGLILNIILISSIAFLAVDARYIKYHIFFNPKATLLRKIIAKNPSMCYQTTHCNNLSRSGE